MTNEVQELFGKVLLIEDDSSHALLVRRALKPFVRDVLHVTSMAEALERVVDYAPELIVSDLNLGAETAVSHFAALKTKVNAPLLVLTASTSLNDAVEAMRQGARDFLVKNFDKDFAEILGFSLARLSAALHLESKQRRLEQQLGMLKVAIENTHDGLALVERDGSLSYYNSAFAGYVTRAGGTIRLLSDCIGEGIKDRDRVKRDLAQQVLALEAGGAVHMEINFINERDFALDLNLVLIGDQHERRFVVLTRDITELRKRQRFQREILATTTHDLKGPLGAIMSSAELIPQFMKDPNRVEQLALRIGSSARTALNLIEEFLSARRIQEGSFILHPKECDLVTITDGVIADFSNMALVRAITLTRESAESSMKVLVDKIGISRVLSNLISNALKFTPKGGSITVRVEESVEQVQLQVADTGSGMEPGDVKKLFGRFSRLERHQDISGTGLGLFVVKAIVTAHGGTISVRSTIGKGTTFEIVLPKQPPVNERGELYCLDFE
jgi:signal transduction histidine kinase